MRWAANVTEYQWRVLLPVSAALQLIAFVIFFVTVSHHKSRPATTKRGPIETWMKLVIAETVAFLLALIFNQVETVVLAATGEHPVTRQTTSGVNDSWSAVVGNRRCGAPETPPRNRPDNSPTCE